MTLGETNERLISHGERIAAALADVRRRFGRQRDAILPLVELLERDPYNTDALLVLAEILLETGRREDAAIAVARLLRRRTEWTVGADPGNPGALFNQGLLLSDAHRYREAIALWQQVVELEPEGEYALRARREARTAADLLRIFRSRQEAVS